MQYNPFRIPSFAIIVGFVCLSLIGIALVPKLTVRTVPSDRLPALTVEYTAPESSPRVLERSATHVLEQMLSRMNGLEGIKSYTTSTGGMVSLSLDKAVNLSTARMEASALVKRAWKDMPKDVSYPSISFRSADGDDAGSAAISYSISSPDDIADIQHVVEAQVVPWLSQIAGVGEVRLRNTAHQEMVLSYDPEQLHSLGLSPSQLQTAISEHFNQHSIGLVPLRQEDGELRFTRAVIDARDADTLDLSGIYLRSGKGNLVNLSSLVKAERQTTAENSAYRINGLNTLFVDISTKDRANQMAVNRQVAALMESLSASKLPEGYVCHQESEAVDQFAKDLKAVYLRSTITILILLLFMFIAIRDKKIVALVLLSLLVNLTIAAAIYYFADVEIHIYSLAGMTISLNLIIDNIIVMCNHLRFRHNIKVFLPMLAATLTTIGALSVVFFLSEEEKVKLTDFVLVVVINLAVSLFVAMFFVPSVQMNMAVDPSRSPNSIQQLRRIVRFTHWYSRFLQCMCKHRVALAVVLVFVFGLPFFLLPAEIDSDSLPARLYNLTLGSEVYQGIVRPKADQLTGGTLRLFMQSGRHDDSFSQDSIGPTISITASLPNGGTMDMMQQSLRQMEAVLTTCDGIKRFVTSVTSPRRAEISVEFTREAMDKGLVLQARNSIVSNALLIGGGTWSVNGPGDLRFSNGVQEEAGDFVVNLSGYNYEQLMAYARELRDTLDRNPRVQKLQIDSRRNFFMDDYSEYEMVLNNEDVARRNLLLPEVADAVMQLLAQTGKDNMLMDERHTVYRLKPQQQSGVDLWALMNTELVTPHGAVKLKDIARVKQLQQPDNIVRENQQYCLVLQFEYVGMPEIGEEMLQKKVADLNKHLPMGFEAKTTGFSMWEESLPTKFLLVLLVLGVIFVITSVLFNSLRQPFAVIMTVPVALIGTFLAFWLTDTDFGEGGLAGIILLCGLTVNAGIYLTDEYNNIRRRHPHLPAQQVFVMSWNAKIIPISLTILSTILGFLPFLFGTGESTFWKSLSLATVSGLIFSYLGIFLFLPGFLLPSKDSERIHVPSL